VTDTFSEREKRIERMENRLHNLKAQQKAQARSRDTKRLVLMGRMLEQYLKYGKVDKGTFLQDMDKFLTRSYEREIFDLPPVSAPEKTKRKSPASQTSRGEPIIIATQKLTPSSPKAQGGMLPEHGVSEAEFLT
jgi:hypothetical protein